MSIDIHYAILFSLIVIPFISLFFIENFLNYPMSILIFFNSCALLVTFYDLKFGNQYGLLQYVLIGHSFGFFALVTYMTILKKKIIEEDLNNLEDV